MDARVSIVGMGAGVVCSCRPMIAMGILVSETSARMNRRSAPNGLSEEGSKVGPKVAMRFGVLRGDEIVIDLDEEVDLVLDGLAVGEGKSHLVDLAEVPVNMRRRRCVEWSCRGSFVVEGFGRCVQGIRVGQLCRAKWVGKCVGWGLVEYRDTLLRESVLPRYWWCTSCRLCDLRCSK